MSAVTWPDTLPTSAPTGAGDAGRRNLALFDFDGTITTRETFGEFLRFAIPPRRFALGRWLLAPLVIGYRLGLIGGVATRAGVVRFGFRGLAEDDIADAGRRFAHAILPGFVRPEMLECIRRHQAQGDTVVVVSGAFDAYLSHWCTQHGLALICSALEARDGVLTGRYRGTQCVGREKPARVLAPFDRADFADVYAYGDTKEDLDMLRIADRRFYCGREMA